MTLRQIVGDCFALLCAVMLGLAAGAIWLLPTLFLRHPMPWLAIPVGWLLAAAIRQWVHGPGWRAALLAGLATAVASVYIHVLISAVNISAMMGYGLLDAMHTAGLSMLLDFAKISMGKADIAWAAVGIIAALIDGRRTPRSKTRTVG
jgi:hypothetical protein